MSEIQYIQFIIQFSASEGVMGQRAKRGNMEVEHGLNHTFNTPQSNPKSKPESDFLIRKVTQKATFFFGPKSHFRAYFLGYFCGDPESHFLVSFELL